MQAVIAHLYDLAHGRPAADVRLRLEALVGPCWRPVGTQRTGDDGRCELGVGVQWGRGTYRLVCETDPYHVGLGATPHYREVVVVFRVADDAPEGQVIVLIATAGYAVFVGL